MLSGAYNASLDCQYDYDDEDQHAFDADEGDLTVEGPTLEHSSTASGFLHTNIGCHRSSLLNQPSPHSVHPPPHSLQLSPHTVHPIPRPRTLRYTSSHPYYRLPSREHDWQHSSWYEHTNSQIHTLIDSQNKLMSMFEKFSDRIGDIEMTVSSLKSDSLSSSTNPEKKKQIPPQLSVC